MAARNVAYWGDRHADDGTFFSESTTETMLCPGQVFLMALFPPGAVDAVASCALVS